MRKVLILILAVVVGISWYFNISELNEKAALFKKYVAAGDSCYESELYEDALKLYNEALEIRNDNVELKLKVAKTEFELGNTKGFINDCKALIAGESINKDAMSLLVDYYKDHGKTEDLVTLASQLYSIAPNDENIAQLWEKYRGSYLYVGSKYDYIGMILNGYTNGVIGDRHLLVKDDGSDVLSAEHDQEGYYSKSLEVIPVYSDGKWYYINLKGNKKIVSDENYEYCGLYCEDHTVAVLDGKYGYIDSRMRKDSDFIWDDATLIFHGIGAVKKGNKWALINSDYILLTDYIFDEVATNDAGYCSLGNVLFAKGEDGYHMFDITGNQITESVFEDVSPLTGGADSIAVCSNGKWGFIDTSGNLVIDYQYEQAKSFANGYAPVKINGLWGYIDENGKIFIEPQFSDANQFGNNGTAPVMDENGVWRMIKLYTSM